LRRARGDNKDASTEKSDHYFHCRANCEASKRGSGGQDAARNLSWLRKIYQTHLHFGKEKETPENAKRTKSRTRRASVRVEMYEEVIGDIFNEN